MGQSAGVEISISEANFQSLLLWLLWDQTWCYILSVSALFALVNFELMIPFDEEVV